MPCSFSSATNSVAGSELLLRDRDLPGPCAGRDGTDLRAGPGSGPGSGREGWRGRAREGWQWGRRHAGRDVQLRRACRDTRPVQTVPATRHEDRAIEQQRKRSVVPPEHGTRWWSRTRCPGRTARRRNRPPPAPCHRTTAWPIRSTRPVWRSPQWGSRSRSPGRTPRRSSRSERPITSTLPSRSRVASGPALGRACWRSRSRTPCPDRTVRPCRRSLVVGATARYEHACHRAAGRPRRSGAP